MLQKQAAVKRRGSKAPPSMANLSLVLQRPLVRPSQAEKKGGKVKLQARSGNNLQASSSKNLQASSSENLKAVASKKLQASSSNKKTNVQGLSKAPSSLNNHGRQLHGKENGNFSKTETNETLGDDLELALRTRLALRKTPMTSSETQLLQMDRKTDWTLWEESCLADWN